MDNITTNSLVVRLVKDIKEKEITEEEAKNLMLEMEEELKDVLFNHTPLDESYKDVVKPKYIEWVRDDPVYPEAVKKYIEGKVQSEIIERLPYMVAVLLVKYIMKKI